VTSSRTSASGLDVVPMDFGSVMHGGRKATTTPSTITSFRRHGSGVEPGLVAEPRSMHMWHPAQKARPRRGKRRSTPSWPAGRHARHGERRRQFTEVQKIFLAHNPAIYFVAPHVLVATSTRVAPVTPAVTPPQVFGRRMRSASRGRALAVTARPRRRRRLVSAPVVEEPSGALADHAFHEYDVGTWPTFPVRFGSEDRRLCP
jgi:hypothetical protein